MSGFADLVPESMPAYFGGGHSSSGAAGSSWRWDFDGIVDNAGNPINLASITGVCKILTDSPGGTEVLSPVVTGGLGTLSITVDESLTASTFTGTDYVNGRKCYWYLTLSDGTDTVHVWMADNSKFQIRRGH